jgi:hypothetical protein
MTTPLGIDEQPAIGLLIDPDATAESRAGMTDAQARDALDEQAVMFEMEDMELVDLWFAKGSGRPFTSYQWKEGNVKNPDADDSTCRKLCTGPTSTGFNAKCNASCFADTFSTAAWQTMDMFNRQWLKDLMLSFR